MQYTYIENNTNEILGEKNKIYIYFFSYLLNCHQLLNRLFNFIIGT